MVVYFGSNGATKLIESREDICAAALPRIANPSALAQACVSVFETLVGDRNVTIELLDEGSGRRYINLKPSGPWVELTYEEGSLLIFYTKAYYTDIIAWLDKSHALLEDEEFSDDKKSRLAAAIRSLRVLINDG